MSDDNIQKMITAFKKIKGLGYVESHRSGNTGIGKTLEDVLEIQENNIDKPDLHSFEIKSQRELAQSRITLFTKAPTNPKGANAFLKDNFGTPDSEFPDIKVLHTSVFHSRFNTHRSGFGFKLECDDLNQRMNLIVKKLENNSIVSNDVYWSYPVLQSILNDKISNLAFVSAKTRHNQYGKEEFFFEKMILFSEITFEKFIQYVKMDDGLMFDIRIGAYKSGRQYGKPHDHGSGFRAKLAHIRALYNQENSIQ